MLKVMKILQAASACVAGQRELNRWSQFSERKLRFFSKVKIFKNAFNKKMMGI